MFDLTGYIESVKGAQLIRDPGELMKPRSGERLSDVTMLTRGNYAWMLEKTWQWAFEAARDAQPAFYRALASANPYFAVAMEPIEDPFGEGVVYQSALFVIGENLVFRVDPGIKSFESDIVDRPQDGWVRLYRSLPEPIARAYYLRTNGMDLTSDEFYLPNYMRGLPGSLTASASVIGYVSMPRQAKVEAKKILSSLADTSVADREDHAADFRVLLDTRAHNDESKAGDLLIYQAFSETQTVYWLPAMDFKKIRPLAAASSALDAYVANTISGGERSFDFSRYCAAE